MTLQNKVGAAIAALSFIGIVANSILIFSGHKEIDRLLISMAYCAMCLALSASSFFCKEPLSLMLHLCSISVGSFLCFNSEGAYLYGAIILAIGVILAYSCGLFSKHPTQKLICVSIGAWLFIAIACPEHFPQSAIMATSYTAFTAIFLYVLFIILRDKIDSEKIVEKRMLNAIDEAENLLSEAMDIIKETNKKIKQGGNNGCQ